MQDPLAVDRGQGVRERAQDPRRPLRLDGAPPDQPLQGLALHDLLNQVGHARLAIQAVDADHVRVLDPAQDLGLAHEALEGRG